MRKGIGEKRKLVASLTFLLVAGFAGTTFFAFTASREALRSSIIANELPVAADTIYAEIQKDLIHPVLVSSMMANDTFVRDWVLSGERNPDAMIKYLASVKDRYGALTAFFVSERTRLYYHSGGVLKRVDASEPRDAWFFRVRSMYEPFETNVDPDMAHRDLLTVFINYRVFDYSGNFIGATGVGLTVDFVKSLAGKYRDMYDVSALFVDTKGYVLAEVRDSAEGASSGSEAPRLLAELEGVGPLADRVLVPEGASVQYSARDRTMLLHSRWIPELGWYLLVEKDDVDPSAGLSRALWVNIGICVAIVAASLLAVALAIERFEGRLESMATTDSLTGLLNRQAFAVLLGHVLKEREREQIELCVLMGDLDFFKKVNDERGHAAGDAVLKATGASIQSILRETDLACRWGGEEFLVLLKACPLQEAVAVAEEIRSAVVAATRPGAEEGASPDDPAARGTTISFGVAEMTRGETFENAVDRADQALYRAKREGRDKVCVA